MEKTNIILECLEELNTLLHSKEKAFNLILDYIANKLEIKNVILSYTTETKEVLDRLIDIEKLKDKSLKDFLGEVYEIVFDTKLIDYSSANQNAMKVKINLKQGQLGTVYIKECETGRVMLSLHHECDSCLFYAIENNELMYKIALINITLYDIPAFIVYKKSSAANIKIPTPSFFKKNISNIWPY